MKNALDNVLRPYDFYSELCTPHSELERSWL